MKKLILKSGVYRNTSEKEIKSELNLNSWFKKLLAYLHIAYVDPCCDLPVSLPTSYNTDTNELVYWNGSDYIPVPTNATIPCYSFSITNLSSQQPQQFTYNDCAGIPTVGNLLAGQTVTMCASYVRKDSTITVTNEGQCLS